MASHVSVLIAVRNGENTLDLAVESILDQSLKSIEVIIVNDGSTDQTATKLSTWQISDSRIKVLHQPALGIVPALNQGLKKCTAPFIARMDADDWSYPDRLLAQKDYLDQHPEIGAVSSRVVHGGSMETQGGYRHHVDWLNQLLSPQDHFQNRFIDQPLANPVSMIRRQVFERVGHYHEGNFPEDYDFWLRCFHQGIGVSKLPQIHLQWNDLPTRATRTLKMYEADRFQALKAKYWKLWALKTWGNIHQKEIWIWGVGKKVLAKIKHLYQEGIEITGFIDVTQRSRYQEKPVIHFNQLNQPSKCSHILVYVADRQGKAKIDEFLIAKSFEPGKDYHIMT